PAIGPLFLRRFMPALWTSLAFDSLSALTTLRHWSSIFFSCLILLSFNSVTIAQGGAAPVTKSFDFRNGAQGWQAGFADYPPATARKGSYDLLAKIGTLRAELGTRGTGSYFKGFNNSVDLLLFLRRVFVFSVALVEGRPYQIIF